MSTSQSAKGIGLVRPAVVRSPGTTVASGNSIVWRQVLKQAPGRFEQVDDQLARTLLTMTQAS